MNILKYGLAAIVGAYLIFTLGSSPAMAAIITGTIKVTIEPNYGAFPGIYTGDFSYDDTHLTKIGIETMTINGENENPFGDRSGLLSLNFTFIDFTTGLIPVTYTAKDHFDFPNGPLLAFENGVPTEFFFLVDPDKKGGVFGPNNGIGFLGDKSFRFGVWNGTTGGEGRVTLEIDKPTPKATFILKNLFFLTSFLAVIVLGAGYLWRKSRTGNN